MESFDNHWQFRDTSGADSLADAAGEARESEAAAQASADQHLDSPEDADRLDAARDPDALAADRPAASVDSAAAEDDSAFEALPEKVPPDDAAIEGTIVKGHRPADAARSLGGTAQSTHVRILFLGNGDTTSVDTAGDVEDEVGGVSAASDTDGPEDGSLEAHHDEQGTHYGVYTAHPDGTLKFEPVDPSKPDVEDDDAADWYDDLAGDEDVDARDTAEDGLTGADGAPEDEVLDEDGNPVVKVLGASWRTVSGAAVTAGSWGLQKYREGPGEGLVEARLRSRARREGRREVGRRKREAWRNAPLSMKRQRRTDVKWQANTIIRDTMTQVIAETHREWSLQQLGDTADPADPSTDEE